MDFLIFLFFGNLILSAVAGYVARGKGRSWFGYFALSVIFSFLLTILVLIALPPLKQTNSQTNRECPFCKEPILRQAVVCKHCGRDVEPLPAVELQSQPIADYKGNKWLTMGSIFTLLGLLMLFFWISGSDDPTIPVASRTIALLLELLILALGIFFVVKGNIQSGKDNPSHTKPKVEKKK